MCVLFLWQVELISLKVSPDLILMHFLSLCGLGVLVFMSSCWTDQPLSFCRDFPVCSRRGSGDHSFCLSLLPQFSCRFFPHAAVQYWLVVIFVAVRAETVNISWITGTLVFDQKHSVVFYQTKLASLRINRQLALVSYGHVWNIGAPGLVLRLNPCFDCVSLQIQTFCGAKSWSS